MTNAQGGERLNCVTIELHRAKNGGVIGMVVDALPMFGAKGEQIHAFMLDGARYYVVVVRGTCNREYAHRWVIAYHSGGLYRRRIDLATYSPE